MVTNPLVWLSIAMIGGAMLGLTSFYWLLGVSVLLGITGWMLNRENFPQSKALNYVAVVLFLTGIYAHFWLNFLVIDLSPFFDRQVQCRAVIIDEPVPMEGQVSCLIRIEEGNPVALEASELIVKVTEGKDGSLPQMAYGQVISLKGILKQPRQALNPGEFDYAQYLSRKGISGQIYIYSPEDIRILKQTWGNPVVYFSLQVKDRLVKLIQRFIQSPEQAAILEGILIGGRRGIDQDTLDIFNYLGIVHILSVSGFQVALVVLAGNALSKALDLPDRIRLWLNLVAVGFYCLITGLVPSVMRAGIMALIALAGDHYLRKYRWAAAMALTAMLLVIFRPTVVMEPGFQLSFAATWAILFLMPVISGLLSKRGLNKWWSGFIAIPIAAQLGTLPVLAWHFNTLSLLSLFGNLLLVWLVTPISYLGFLGLAVGSIYPVAGALPLKLAGILTQWMTNGAEVMAGIPGGNWYIKSPAIWMILAWYCGLSFYIMWYRGHEVRILVQGWLWRRERAALGLLTVGVVLLFLTFNIPGNTLEVTFLAVGQGDGAVIHTPDDKYLLVDTGGKSPGGEFVDPGERIVVPYLRSMGINRLDGIILTHPDSDHIGGLWAIVKSFPVEQVFISPVFTNDSNGKQTVSKLRELRVSVEEMTGTETWQLSEDIEIGVLNPDLADKSTEDASSNNNSLVLKLNYGKRSILMTGDVEKEALVKLVGRGDLAADVVKVPHHGALTSFLAEAYLAIKPSQAIISVGKNLFGHPHSTVENYLQASVQGVWRTDKLGAVTVRTDGEKMWLSAYKGRP